MNIYDVIFWYTGCTAWSILALAFLVVVFLAMLYATGVVYRYQKQWMFALLVCSRKDRAAIMEAVRRVGYPQCSSTESAKNSTEFKKWLDDMSDEYDKAKDKYDKDGLEETQR